MKKTPLIFFAISAVSFSLLILSLFIKKHDEYNDPYLKKLSYRNGFVTKIEYEDHTYVCWSCNLGSSMVHDPECKCRKKIE